MKRYCIIFVVAALTGITSQAQSNPFSADARSAYAAIKENLLKAAEKMPEESYSFRTVPTVRSYGEMIAHVADTQVMLCSTVSGQAKRGDAASKKTKAGLIAALEASFDGCDSVYDAMTDTAGTQTIKLFGRNVTELGVLNMNVAHDNETYGTMVAFMRIKGIVPPSSEGRP